MEMTNNTDYVSFIDIVRILKKRKVFIALATILFTTIMAMKVVFFSTPMYMASAKTILVKDNSSTVSNPQYNSGDIYFLQEVTGTYAEIASSDAVINKTVEELRLYSSAQIRASVTVVVNDQNKTQIIQLNAVNSSPQGAADIVNAYCKSFIEESMNILPVAQIQVLDPGKLPIEPISNKGSLMIVFGFLFGLIASIGIVLSKYYIDSNKIGNVKQITRILNIPVLVIIE